MADRDLLIVTRATTHDLLTLAELKTILGLSPSDTSQDEQLQMQISIASATIAELANRTFAEETLIETWREIGDGRLFLSHWPIKEADGIAEVTAGGTALAPADYDLEGDSGKLAVYSNGNGAGSWAEPVKVHYTGGYKLPEEAPLPLKYAAALQVREERMRNQQAQVAGIRMLSHKEARVMFYDPNALLAKTITAQSPGQQAVQSLIKQYMRIEV